MTTASCLDSTATPGVDYYYWIVAVGSGGTSGKSAVVKGARKLSAPTLSSSGGNAYGINVNASSPEGATSVILYYQNESTGWQPVSLGRNWHWHQYGTPTQYYAVAVGANGTKSANSSPVQLN